VAARPQKLHKSFGLQETAKAGLPGADPREGGCPAKEVGILATMVEQHNFVHIILEDKRIKDNSPIMFYFTA
jgi:hypothetical protein